MSTNNFFVSDWLQSEPWRGPKRLDPCRRLLHQRILAARCWNTQPEGDNRNILNAWCHSISGVQNPGCTLKTGRVVVKSKPGNHVCRYGPLFASGLIKYNFSGHEDNLYLPHDIQQLSIGCSSLPISGRWLPSVDDNDTIPGRLLQLR